MKAEPTLNEMCEYIENKAPLRFGFSIDQHRHSETKTVLWIKTPEPKKGFFRCFNGMRAATEFLFNYYFAVNNK